MTKLALVLVQKLTIVLNVKKLILSYQLTRHVRVSINSQRVNIKVFVQTGLDALPSYIE